MSSKAWYFITQRQERRPSNPADVRSSHGRGGHVCACHVVVKYHLANKGYALQTNIDYMYS